MCTFMRATQFQTPFSQTPSRKRTQTQIAQRPVSEIRPSFSLTSKKGTFQSFPKKTQGVRLARESFGFLKGFSDP